MVNEWRKCSRGGHLKKRLRSQNQSRTLRPFFQQLLSFQTFQASYVRMLPNSLLCAFQQMILRPIHSSAIVR